MTPDPGPLPPSTLRATWLITALAFCRLKNQFSRIGRKKSPGVRQGTARKRAFGGPIVVILAALFMFNGFSQSTGLVNRIALAAERRANPDVMLVDRHVMTVLDNVGTYLRERDHGHELEPIDESLAKIAGRFLDRRGVRDDAERERRTAAFVRAYQERGKAGFRESSVPGAVVLPSAKSWFAGDGARGMLLPLGLVASLLAVAVVLLSSSAVNQDVAKVEWSFEWLFTFPVPARSLLLARALETAIANPMAWFVPFPFFTTVFLCAGQRLLAPLLGVVATIYLGLLAGSLRVVLETGLRRYFSLRNVARIQALLSVFGSLAFMASVLVVSSPDLLEPVLAFAERMPTSAVMNPLNPIGLASAGALGRCSACIAFAAAAVLGATTLGGWFVRDGLTTSAGPHQGRRHTKPSRAEPRLPLGAVARKELLLLVRDRKRLAQVFLSPVLLFGSQFLFNGRWARTFVAEPRHAASMAFVGTAIALTTGGLHTIATDAPALWLYFTVPKRVESLFAQQALFWSALVAPLAIGVFVAVVPGHGAALFYHAPLVAFMLVGIVLQAFIVTALGVFGTDVLDNDPRRRVRPSIVYLATLLTGIFGFAIYAPSLWAKIAHLVLFALLAYALWQKVSDHARLLLDPNELPPPCLSVADGVVAALAFFVLQGFFTFVLVTANVPLIVSVVFAFGSAGLLVGVFALYTMWRNRVPDLAATLGLVLPRGKVLFGIATGVSAGLVTGLLARGYLLVVDRVDMLRALRPELDPHSIRSAGVSLSFVVLATIAAPIFEEFIFRGMLYGGFRRSFRPIHAALASAVVFAIVHPAIASLPVFVMGFVAALVYGRFRTLLAPIAVHMTYNAIVVAMSATL
ncbi:MAG TPA: type II CAAX endopeptidase family protein [Polyangiaceae bacterium]|nr:type II CAAX endopeptidase family protein [Polyangiaceae bacterium]